MSALILVAGMNLAHRSMVAKQISLRLEPDSFDMYDCCEPVPAHMFVRMMTDVLERKRNVIIENPWLGDYVLGAMGQVTSLPNEFKRMLDRIALGCDAQVAYCVADTNTYAINANNFEPDSYSKYEVAIGQMHKCWEEFDFKGLSITRIDTRDSGYILDIEVLMDRVDLYSESNPGVGIGSWSPAQVTLIVGDRHGPSIQPYQTDINLPFCDMAKAGASYWLSAQLDKAGVPENGLYWINAYDKEVMPTHPGFVSILKPRTIIAVGDNAAKWCETNHFRYESFHHPQYHKRFLFNEVYPLVGRLQEIHNESK